jgi:predicted acetyltransferase
MKFREATSKDRQIIRNISRYAFDGTRNQYEDPNNPPPPSEWYSVKNYVVEESNSIIATVGVIEFSQRIRGSFIKSAGMTQVACRPEYRRQGYMSKLFKHVFNKVHQEHYLVSTLYPFSFHFYEQLGYGQADSLHFYSFKCSDIIQRPTPNRIITEDFDPNFKRCQPIYDLLSQRIDGLVKRLPESWKYIDSWNWKQGGFQFICQDLNGNDLGYIILRFEKKDESIQTSYINVREMVFFDSETKQAFLNFLANHDSQREYFKIVPFDRNYLPYLKSPRIKENQEVPNSMFRIIDVEHLLPLLNYPGGIETQITLDIVDSTNQCPWNSKKFTLNIKNGVFSLVETPSSNYLRLGIKALSQIVIGFHDPFELAEVGEIEGSPHSVNILASIFPKQMVALRDYF